jgi:hypothetical protein
MSIVQIFHQLTDSKQFSTVIILLAADLVFGVLAAFKTRTFDLARIADLLRDDGVKAVVWAAAFFFAAASAGGEIVGLNLTTIADGAFVGLSASIVGSLLNSFEDLGLPLPPALAKVGIGRGAQAPAAYPADHGDQPPAA